MGRADSHEPLREFVQLEIAETKKYLPFYNIDEKIEYVKSRREHFRQLESTSLEPPTPVNSSKSDYQILIEYYTDYLEDLKEEKKSEQEKIRNISTTEINISENTIIQSNANPLQQTDTVKLDYNKQIFKSEKGFLLFEALINDFPKEINDNYGFIFHKLIADGYMFRVTHTTFKEYLNAEPYKITIDKIKTLNVLSNKQRLALYSSILKSIK